MAGILLPGVLLLSGCAPPPLHIAPAHEGMDRKAVAFLDRGSAPVLDGHAMAIRKVDDVPVQSYFQVALSPGWHFLEYGYSESAGCGKYRHTRVYVDYGVGVLRDPSRDRTTCLEPVVEHHTYSGWFLVEGGRRYRWPEVQPLVKVLPDSGDPSPYDKHVPGVPYRKR